MGAEKTPGSGGDSEGPRENDSHVRAWALLARFLDQHTLSDSEAVERFVADHPPEERALREILRGFHTIRADANRTSTDDKIAEGPGDNIPKRPGDNGHTGDSAGALAELLSRIREDIGRGTRFTEREQIGSGGIGVVYKLWDANLRRSVAKKTIRADKLRPDSAHRIQWIARFLEEAQITAQLDHPGVVPIHDMGFESDGQIYFTMRFVRGDTLLEVIQKSHAAVDGWNRTRVVSALLRVCETIAYAHGKDVIHRDLKPANIMVGRYGETYVMDWGLARKLGNPDLRDLRIRPATPQSTDVLTDARGVDDTGLFTLDGHAIGTPAYMAPEQAAGDLDRIGKPADIYSLGAILYEILAGHPPYHEPGVHAKAHAICRWVLDGPPAKLHTRAPDAPPELIAICERAMARATSQRYASVEAMAEDLRAYLENRVVKAHRTGPISELRKWVSRNRLAAGIAGILVVAMGGTGYVLNYLQSERRSVETTAADAERIRALIEEWPEISIYDPDARTRLSRWLIRARDIQQRHAAYEDRFHELRDQATRIRVDIDSNVSDSLISIRKNYEAFTEKSELIEKDHPEFFEKHRGYLERARGAAEVRNSYNIRGDFEDHALEREFAQIAAILRRLPELEFHEFGALPRVQARLDSLEALAETLEERTRSDWERFARIAGGEGNSPYTRHPIDLQPVPGLIPWRQHPRTRLLEFVFTPSGKVPEVNASNEPQVIDGFESTKSGIVFVLVPQGVVELGYQCVDSSKPNHRTSQLRTTPNPGSEPKLPYETFSVTVRPFLIAKHELTQFHWWKLAGFNPSTAPVGFLDEPRRTAGFEDNLVTEGNPVETVSHAVAERYLAAWNMGLPTIAEWVLAAGGTDPEAERLIVVEGVASLGANLGQPDPNVDERWRPFDGYMYHAPVGSFEPNANGLFDVHGNVSELVADSWINIPKVPELAATLVPRFAFPPSMLGGRTIQGSSFSTAIKKTATDSLFSIRRRSTTDLGWESPPSDAGIRPVLFVPWTSK